MHVWLKRAGYTIGAIIALILIVISFVYGMDVPHGERQTRERAAQWTLSIAQVQ